MEVLDVNGAEGSAGASAPAAARVHEEDICTVRADVGGRDGEVRAEETELRLVRGAPLTGKIPKDRGPGRRARTRGARSSSSEAERASRARALRAGGPCFTA